MNQTILTSPQLESLNQLIGFSNRTYRLIYRASRDGFSAINFHTNCDNVSSTLVIIQSAKLNIFGGYTSQAWASLNTYVTDVEAFLFSLVNPTNNSLKILVKSSGKQTIYTSIYGGPNFGNADIVVYANSNIYNNSYFANRAYQYPANISANTLFDGATQFKTKDIEVYNII